MFDCTVVCVCVALFCFVLFRFFKVWFEAVLMVLDDPMRLTDVKIHDLIQWWASFFFFFASAAAHVDSACCRLTLSKATSCFPQGWLLQANPQ